MSRFSNFTITPGVKKSYIKWKKEEPTYIIKVPENVKTITEAVARARIFKLPVKIEVAPGEYKESILLDFPVILRGELLSEHVVVSNITVNKSDADGQVYLSNLYIANNLSISHPNVSIRNVFVDGSLLLDNSSLVAVSFDLDGEMTIKNSESIFSDSSIILTNGPMVVDKSNVAFSSSTINGTIEVKNESFFSIQFSNLIEELGKNIINVEEKSSVQMVHDIISGSHQNRKIKTGFGSSSRAGIISLCGIKDFESGDNKILSFV